jgi:tetratricopeptide (TPR) repeat protein
LIASTLFLNCALSAQAQAVKTEDALLTSLADLELQIRAGNALRAAKSVTPIHRFLVSKAGPTECRPGKTDHLVLSQPKAAETLLRNLRDSVAQKDYPASCRTTMLLGIALNRDFSQMSPAARLAQYERNWTESGSRPDLPSLDDLAWANYETGQLKKAQDYADSVLAMTAKLTKEMQPDYFQHSAWTVLGLTRLQAGSTSEARQFLQQSIEIQPGMMLLGSRPALRLADALWKKGEHQAVLQYLEQASKMDWVNAKPAIQNWLEQARKGEAPSFFGVTGPIGK